MNLAPNNDQSLSRRVYLLAWPMIIANLSVPLLGLVDTAILGHLADSRYLSAVAISTSLLAFLYWGFGFLRMGTTGASAQLLNDTENSSALLIKAMVLALLIALIVMLAGRLALDSGLQLMNTSEQLMPLARNYLAIRLLSAPAVLCTYVVVGWLIGRQQTRWPLIIAVCTNLLNIVLDYFFIIVFEQHSDGAARASAISEYGGLILALWAVRRSIAGAWTNGMAKSWARGPAFRQLLSNNRQLFVRTVALLFSFAFFTAQGATFGQASLAANAILLQLMMVSAYGMDGFAHAAEALCGEAYSRRDRRELLRITRVCGYYCGVTAVMASLLLWLGQNSILSIMTGLAAVNEIASAHYFWLIALPLLCAPSYLLDGIFIGALQTRAMQWSMLGCVGIVYLPVWFLSQDSLNHGLWFSFCAFNLARGLSLGWLYSALIVK